MDALLDDLDQRGLVHDTTDRAALAARLAEGPITLYYGCDPTAPSLHHGNLIGLLVLRRFQDAGHRPLALAGGATGMVGDPGGRSEERNLLAPETLAANVAAIKGQIARILGPEGPWALVDNLEWTGELRLLDFLRDVGKHITVNQMVARESVRARMAGEHGISYTEFSYMLLQANDYAHLHAREGCELQIGGSDQWGNILSGVDLIRRQHGAGVHALCWPLLTAGDGSKIGKTAGARVWLDPALTSPYAFFQHWMQTDDAEVARMLAQFTLLPMDEVAAVLVEHMADPKARSAQRRLAGEVTELVHGRAARDVAEAASPRPGADPFTQNLLGAALAHYEDVWPTLRIVHDELPVSMVDLLVRTGAAPSRSAALRLIRQRGAHLNNETVLSEDARITSAELLEGRWLVVRPGKKLSNQRLVVVERSGGPDPAG